MLRWQVTWPDSTSEWCFWASFVAIVGLIGTGLAAPIALAAGAEEAVDVLWTVTQFIFAGFVAVFLLGTIAALVGNFRGERRGSWRL